MLQNPENVPLTNFNELTAPEEHIPVNNEVLVLLVEAKNSHILEKYINDY